MSPADLARPGRALAALLLALLMLLADAVAPAAQAPPADGEEAPGGAGGRQRRLRRDRGPAQPAQRRQGRGGALRGLGFEVVEAVDLDHARHAEALAEFARRLEGAEAGLFFYAGHGLQIAGANYLVPVDARLSARRRCGCRRCRSQTCCG